MTAYAIVQLKMTDRAAYDRACEGLHAMTKRKRVTTTPSRSPKAAELAGTGPVHNRRDGHNTWDKGNWDGRRSAHADDIGAR